jgi:hypothetical protein
VPCSDDHYGEAFGTVGGLIAGLSGSRGQALLDGGARRMRALTGYDRVTLFCGESGAESSRGAFAQPASRDTMLPPIVSDCDGQGVGVFPKPGHDTSIAQALLRAPDEAMCGQMRSEGIRAALRVPFDIDGITGEFRCDSRVPRRPSFELHAAAELFAQLFVLRLQVDRLRTG